MCRVIAVVIAVGEEEGGGVVALCFVNRQWEGDYFAVRAKRNRDFPAATSVRTYCTP
jgi:hypothetical protein